MTGCHEALLLHGRRWHEGWYLFQSRLSHPHANEGPESLLRIEMLRTTIKNMTYVLIPQFTESQKSVTVHYPRHLYSVSPPFLIYAVVVQSQILSSHCPVLQLVRLHLPHQRFHWGWMHSKLLFLYSLLVCLNRLMWQCYSISDGLLRLRQIYWERFCDLVTNIDTVEYSW